ncbi:MAG: molybdenum cofactor biosynthesis protein MoaE [Clostridia bacterium]|nr:molybdenum cofactor biosynthesis protein MoaE [Clostridia bacterium]
MGEKAPSVDLWLQEAKAEENAAKCGMYLVHNGVVRQTAKAMVREGAEGTLPVKGMRFGYDAKKVKETVEKTKRLPGIYHVRAWLNEGELALGEDLMLVLIGGDIRPHVVDALQFLVGALKQECVFEIERT